MSAMVALGTTAAYLSSCAFDASRYMVLWGSGFDNLVVE